MVFEMRSHNVEVCLAVRGRMFGTGPDARGDVRHELISVLSEKLEMFWKGAWRA